MRITFLYPELGFTDGTARLIASVQATREAGHDASVVSRNARRTDALLKTGATCVESELPERGLLGAFAVGRTRDQVARLAPDLLHVTDIRLAHCAERLSESLGCPYVLELVRPIESALHPTLSWLRAVLLPCSTFVESAVNKGGVPRSLLRIIEHGPDIDCEFAPRREIGKRRPVLMCFGTLDRDHGLDVLIEAARLMRKAGRELNYMILGEGPEEEEYRRQVRELELADVMTITAPVLPDINTVLALADLHVSCARRGNPGWHAVRALGMGIPSIFSAISSTFPLIEDRSNGLLVERNAPQKLVESLATLLDNPKAAKLMGVKARAKMKSEDRARLFREELSDLHTTAVNGLIAR